MNINDARLLPAFADHDDTLFDLSNEEFEAVLIDLTRRCCDALKESIEHISDSHVDDVNILSIIIPTLTNIIYGYDQTEPDGTDALLRALDEGLIQDLTDLRDAGNSYDNLLIDDATIWHHININKTIY